MSDDQHHPPPNGRGVHHLLALADGIINVISGALGSDSQHGARRVRQGEHLGLDHTRFDGDDIHAVTSQAIA